MNHTVVWLPAAERDLAELWLNSDQRDAITLASQQLERLLRNDPNNEGEDRPHQRRILFEAPLGVIYRVLQADRVVIVLRVWSTARRT